MKIYLLSLIPFFMLPTASFATPLSEPKLNECSTAKGITKCEVKCIRSLGEQCLITHINFEGKNLKAGAQLWRSKFLTCKNANIDLQIKFLAVELEKQDDRKGQAAVKALVTSSKTSTKLKTYPPITFDKINVEGRISRIPFVEFGNSGESFIEASLSLAQCGHEDGSNTCTVSGKFASVTDPNIRCDFHDTTKPGAFIPPSLQTSPSLQNSQQPIGRIGE